MRRSLSGPASAIATIAVSVSASVACSTPDPSEEASPDAASSGAQADWVVVSTTTTDGTVALTVPPELAAGESTPDWGLIVVSGDDAATPAGRANEVERDSAELDGRHGELYHFAGVTEGRRPAGLDDLGHWTVAAFGTSSRSDTGEPVVIWLTYRTVDQRRDAETIIGSVRFDH